MTERGLPIVDGPVACPFVAFDDDRDERAPSPDHRHRCYAEPVPAPRALAHQAAYCLSSAFPVCPTFQDWARREAARARNDAAPPDRASAPPLRRDDRGLPPYSPDAGFDDGAETEDEPVFEDRPRRNPQRDWASPPPWLNRSDPGDVRSGRSDDADDGDGKDDRTPAPQAGGLAGSFADRLASNGPVTAPAGGPTADAPIWRTGDSWDDELEPAVEADEWEPPEPEPAHPSARAALPITPTQPPARHRERERDQARGGPAEHDDRPSVGASRASGDRKRDLVAPAWERPARLEAYPSLRSRRMPALAIPGIVVGALAVLLAAALLFFLPGLLGVGSPQSAASPTPTTAASVAPASIVPTEIPQPTQQTYTVASGDTMSRIANHFHIPLQTLIDANKTNIPNPNVLNIGDIVIIPSTTPTALPGESPAASAP